MPTHLIHLRLVNDVDAEGRNRGETVSYLGNLFPSPDRVNVSGASAEVHGRFIKQHITDAARRKALSWLQHLNSVPDRQPTELEIQYEVSLSWHPISAAGTGSMSAGCETPLSTVPDDEMKFGVQWELERPRNEASEWTRLFAVVVDINVVSQL
jgi:hypothetical protein